MVQIERDRRERELLQKVVVVVETTDGREAPGDLVTMVKHCELCKSPAMMHCESDRASLCWECDARVHGANFLVARHPRLLLCRSCQAPTPWRASGARLGPTFSLCENCLGGAGGGRGVVDKKEERASGGIPRRDGDEDDEEEDDDDDHDEEEEEDDDEEEEEDEDHQVVPLAMESVTPPPVASCSSSEESSSSYSRPSSASAASTSGRVRAGSFRALGEDRKAAIPRPPARVSSPGQPRHGSFPRGAS